MLSVMNSLNILSGLGTTPPSSPPRSRTSSASNINDPARRGSQDQAQSIDAVALSDRYGGASAEREAQDVASAVVKLKEDVDEKIPLLNVVAEEPKERPRSRAWQIPKRVVDAITNSLKIVFTALTAPCRYVFACFYDEQGHFSAILPLRKLDRLLLRRKRKATAQAVGLSSAPDADGEHEKAKPAARRTSTKRSPSVDSVASSASTDSEFGEKSEDSPARNTRSRASGAHQRDEIAPAKKSIRIKLGGDEALRKRKQAKLQQKKAEAAAADPKTTEDQVAALATSLKSPSSPTTTKRTRYPRHPSIPRPLVPRRQPSYSMAYSNDAPKKTLIIDLDETLIHSMAKGGRMSTGHMVEVKLGMSMGDGGSMIGAGVPILYYVHERPHCHEFLRKICKWYDLVVFTASVQEYADPVIDWLERERKYFSSRYYRQHCTFRNGAYIKDLAQVEPDLSKVMILDNSPVSYIFHEDNAIPIEGWISDPTDHELLHLIPLLEGLQYVTDVRALLALRQGQAQQA